MKIDELIDYLQKISSDGKGEYSVYCEGFCTEVEAAEVDNSLKAISFL